jgi:DNA repair exonuclease SbcCD nuclease subunit
MLFIFGDLHAKDSREGINWTSNVTAFGLFCGTLGVSKGDTMLFLGDVYDRVLSRGNTHHEVIKLFESLSAMSYDESVSNSGVIILTGNHDYSRHSGSNLRTLAHIPGVQIVDNPKIFEIASSNFLMLPFKEELLTNGPYEAKVRELVGDTKIDFILGHYFFKENSVFSSSYMDIDLFNTSPETVTIMGHNHKHQKISSNRICLGGVSPTNKSEKDYDYKYVKINKGRLSILPIDQTNFLKFREEDLDQIKSPEDKTLFIVKCSCDRKDRYLKESEIYSKLGSSAYDIQWDFKDAATTSVKIEKETDLVSSFFKENEYSEQVINLFNKYYKGL